ERPHPRPRRVGDAAGGEVAVEAGLVDGVDGPEAHGDRRELPELGHEPRVRVAREPGTALHLAPEMVELPLGEPAFEEGARGDAGRGVALEVDLVARAAVVLAAEEVVEANLEQARR